jgi:hypothetical protein
LQENKQENGIAGTRIQGRNGVGVARARMTTRRATRAQEPMARKSCRIHSSSRDKLDLSHRESSEREYVDATF